MSLTMLWKNDKKNWFFTLIYSILVIFYIINNLVTHSLVITSQ